MNGVNFGGKRGASVKCFRGREHGFGSLCHLHFASVFRMVLDEGMVG
jgi:hypothetical protein